MKSAFDLSLLREEYEYAAAGIFIDHTIDKLFPDCYN